jgi:site-specific recombinase XerD
MGIKQIGTDLYRLEWYPEGRKLDPATGKPNTKRETSIFKGSEADARIELAHVNRKARKAPLTSPAFREIVGEYLVYYKNKNCVNTVKDWNLVWRVHLEPVIGNVRPNRLTPAIIEQYKANRLLKAKPITIERELYYLSGLINWMVKNNYADPLHFKIENFPSSKTRPPPTYVPTQDQIDAILAQMRQPQQDICRIIYLCGLRKSEAMNLTVERTQLESGYIMVLGKGNKDRIVPLSDEAKVILKRHIKGKQQSDYIWINPNTKRPFTSFKQGLKQAAKRAKIDMRMYPHLLRHSTLTHLAQHGANAFQIQTLAGHSDIETSQKYIHLALAGLTDLIKKIDRTVPLVPRSP